MLECPPLRLCLVLAFVAAGPLLSQTPPDLEKAAEEFKIRTRNLGYRADSPRRSSSARSSGSRYHGRLTHNFRNDFLDATPHDVKQRGGDKNILRRNQFGFNVSGPVDIPKIYDGGRRTFFSLSYEGVREKIGRSYLRTVPIASQREGDFTHVVDSAGQPLRVFDPASTRPNPNYDPARPVDEDNLEFLRDPFPTSRIPDARQDPVARRMLDYYPLPNANAGPFDQNNFFVFSPETNTADGMIARVDHTFLEKHRVTVGYSFTNGVAQSARFFANEANPGPPDRDYSNRRGSIEHVYTASPQSVNTATFEVYSDISANQAEGENIPESLGLTGLSGDVFPWVRFGNYLALGRSNPFSRHARHTYVLTDAHSLRRGKHNLRFVGQFVRYQVNTSLPNYPSGTFRFGSGLSSLPGIVNTGNSFAGFLLGEAEYAEQSLVPNPSYFRNWHGTLAAQDNWEIRQGLNMSFGLNYSITSPRTERYNRMSTVDLSTTNPENNLPGALIFAGRNGAPTTFQTTQWRPQPNWSLAWNPRGNRAAVVRLSYAMSFQSFVLPNGQWGTQGFNGYAQYISQNVQLQPAVILRDGVPPPATPVPDLSHTAANYTTADLVDRSNRLPRYQSANVSYERELPSSIVLSGGLGLAWGKDLFIGGNNVNLNAIHPDNLSYRDQLNDELFRRTLRPYPQYLAFELNGLYADGRYRREAAWTRLEKRTSGGLSVNLYYEYSRQYDDYSGPGPKQDYFNRENEWGLTAYNNPHRLSFNYMYELPIGANKPYLAYQDWRRFLTNGWSISGISSVSSGEPLAIRPQFNNTGGVIAGLRVNTVPGVDPNVPNQSPSLWFNPAAFEHPADFTLGNGPRTHPTLRNPTAQNHDLSVSKRFPIDQERTLEFNASGFNFINRGNWSDPDVTIGTASAPNANAGKIIGSIGGRVIQLGLRFSF